MGKKNLNINSVYNSRLPGARNNYFYILAFR